MRAVNKGENPGKEFKKYQDAEPYLENRIGAYCSYCEFPITHVPEVEHKVSKSEGGELLEWNNLLLACKYCNSRKNNHIKPDNKGDYLWPDEDDTFHVYSYKESLPKLNESYLEEQDEEVRRKAQNLYDLVGLGNKPSLEERDRRFFERVQARNIAEYNRTNWELFKNAEEKYRKPFLENIIQLAKYAGFFSTWMDVFADEEEVKNALADAFVGTRKDIIEMKKSV